MYDGVSLASTIMATMMNHAAALCIFELDYARRYWNSDEYDRMIWKVHGGALERLPSLQIMVVISDML